MIKNIKNTYVGTKVRLDNNDFTECSFTNCILEFAGEGPVSLNKCSFANCQWAFVGPAQTTMQFLQSMYHGMGDGGRAIVEGTFENIKRGTTKA